MTIPDNATATVSSVLHIPAMGVVQDVNVIDLTGTHTWINDLIVRVISPSGTVVTLFSQICNNQDDFFVSFDDQATLTTLPCPPTSGLTYQPNQPLS
ncbi:proprotein convertase P-domain-containing protein, partial [Arthrospira platensis SPKY2]